MTAEDIAKVLGGRRVDASWMARCPAHDDRVPSLSIRLDLPDDVREVIVLADGDEPGEAAARDCAWRWKREGRRVRIARANARSATTSSLTRHAYRAIRAIVLTPSPQPDNPPPLDGGTGTFEFMSSLLWCDCGLFEPRFAAVGALVVDTWYRRTVVRDYGLGRSRWSAIARHDAGGRLHHSASALEGQETRIHHRAAAQ